MAVFQCVYIIIYLFRWKTGTKRRRCRKYSVHKHRNLCGTKWGNTLIMMMMWSLRSSHDRLDLLTENKSLLFLYNTSYMLTASSHSQYAQILQCGVFLKDRKTDDMIWICIRTCCLLWSLCLVCVHICCYCYYLLVLLLLLFIAFAEHVSCCCLYWKFV